MCGPCWASSISAELVFCCHHRQEFATVGLVSLALGAGARRRLRTQGTESVGTGVTLVNGVGEPGHQIRFNHKPDLAVASTWPNS